MDTTRFDRLTRHIATGLSRRSLLGAATAAGAASILGVDAISAQEATPAATQEPADSSDSTTPSYLFVQQAGGGAIASSGDGKHELTLTGVSPQTVFFADRPDRQAGALATARFLELDGMFAADNPPNAAIAVADPADQADDVLILVLRAPAYDSAAGTLRYTVTPIGELGSDGVFQSGVDEASLPGTFGYVSLFIDDGTVEHEIQDDYVVWLDESG